MSSQTTGDHLDYDPFERSLGILCAIYNRKAHVLLAVHSIKYKPSEDELNAIMENPKKLMGVLKDFDSHFKPEKSQNWERDHRMAIQGGVFATFDLVEKLDRFANPRILIRNASEAVDSLDC